MSEPSPPKINHEVLQHCAQVLEAIADDTLILSQLSSADRVRFMMAAGRVIHPEQAQIRHRLKAMRSLKRKEKESKDRALRATTSIRASRKESVFIAPIRQLAEQRSAASSVVLLERPRDCYICKESFAQVHFFYDSMCPACAQFNYEKRFQTAPLHGRVAIITGARMKIGYQAALMLLRAGARVIVTTRFPQDAAVRFGRETDFLAWGSRLQIHGLDLRHSPSVEVFTRLMDQTLDRLDFLINNAAQTVRRPPGFYQHLMEIETQPFEALPKEAQKVLEQHEQLKRALIGEPGTQWLADWHQGKAVPTLGITASAALSQIPYRFDEETSAEHFPAGQLDADLQQVDQRGMNSWRMRLADVPTAEMLEVQLVNSVAPFILCSKLKPLMMRDRTGAKHVINVSAMEGKFARHTKTDKHPHTNMAKAALNMMTLTSARDYVRDGIYMNAVDTGWVTDEDPAAL